MKRMPIAMVAVVAALAVTGCSSDVTATRLEPSVATTFGRLLILQQSATGTAPPAPAAVQSSAVCQRGTAPGGKRSGAGSDWACVVTYSTPAGVGSSRLEVQAKPDGCWTADGSSLDVGPQTLHDETTGAAVINPLAEFDGCFDITLRAR